MLTKGQKALYQTLEHIKHSRYNFKTLDKARNYLLYDDYSIISHAIDEINFIFNKGLVEIRVYRDKYGDYNPPTLYLTRKGHHLYNMLKAFNVSEKRYTQLFNLISECEKVS